MSDLSRNASPTVYEIINLKVFTALIEALPRRGEGITRVCNNVTYYVDTSAILHCVLYVLINYSLVVAFALIRLCFNNRMRRYNMLWMVMVPEKYFLNTPLEQN